MQVLAADDNRAPRRCRDILAGGGLIVYPTDTLYGFGVDPFNEAAIERLIAAKGRPGPFSVMVGSLDRLNEILLVPTADGENIRLMLPGPFTFVAPPREPKLWPPALTGSASSLGVRVANHPFLTGLFAGSPQAIVSTSVNATGQPPLQDSEAISSLFGNALDLLIDAGRLPTSRGSTVMDLSQTPWRVLRQGDGEWDG